MRRYFAVEKFKALLLAGSFTVLASYIVRLSDSIIAGNLLGEAALAGVNLVGPCLSFVSFLGGLISAGMATNYSISLGKCDTRRAREFFMQGLWSVLIFGGVLSTVLFFGREVFVSFFGADAAVSDCASAYLSWIWPVAVLEGLVMLLVSLGYADGDGRTCMLGYVVIFVGNFVASVVAVKAGLGVAGCAIGSVIAETLGVLTMLLHFVRKSNTFHPVFHFSVLDTFRIMRASFGDAAAFLCDGLLFFFLNKFAIMVFGPEVLPVVAVVTALWGFLEIFNGVGVALQPIVTVYYGENNYRPIRTVLNSAMRIAVLEGLLLAAICWIFPGEIVRLVGLSEPASVQMAASAVRCMSFGFVALALAGLFNSYYMFIERAALAGAVTFLCYLILPVACVAAGALIGVNGVWLGLAAGPFAGLVVVSAVLLTSGTVKGFPSLLSAENEDRVWVYDLELTEDQIVEVSRKIGSVPGVPIRASLLTEEVFMVVRDRARGRRLLGEATLDLRDGVQLTLRDDGEIFDITDADQRISSLRTFLVASVMQRSDGRQNLVTTGFNRNVFRF